MEIVSDGTLLQLRTKQEKRWWQNDIGGVLADAYVGGDCEGNGEDGEEEEIVVSVVGGVEGRRQMRWGWPAPVATAPDRLHRRRPAVRAPFLWRLGG